jgi:hypothetical protein
MRKILILLGFTLCFGLAQKVNAQCNYYSCASPGYYWDLAAYTYFWDNASNSMKAAYSIDMGFNAIFTTISMLEDGKRLENQINAGRNALENYNSVKRYYTEGIPPFATQGPDGKPRSPKITWSDVESIH